MRGAAGRQCSGVNSPDLHRPYQAGLTQRAAPENVIASPNHKHYFMHCCGAA